MATLAIRPGAWIAWLIARWLAFDIPAAKIYGTLAALVRRSGRNPRPRRMDLQIAATAAAHRLPLLTKNIVDFAGLERVVDVIPLRPRRR
jgi:predicted nucleic acid-binding protein